MLEAEVAKDHSKELVQSFTAGGDSLPPVIRETFLLRESAGDLWPDVARQTDPQLAAKYHRLIVERRLHHYSAICHLATTLLTRIAACWRRGERYVIRDIDGRRITAAEGKAIVKARYRIPPETRTRTRIPQQTSGSAQ